MIEIRYENGYFHIKIDYPENEFYMKTNDIEEFKKGFLKNVSDNFDVAISSDPVEIGEKLRGVHNNIVSVVKSHDEFIGKYYDLETILWNNNLEHLSMSPNKLKQCRLKKYKHVKLININGLVVGQVHFVTDDGKYLLLPWCYIISMIPSEVNKCE